MYAAVIVFLSLMLAHMAANVANLHWGNHVHYKTENAYATVASVSSAIEQYANEFGAYPDDLDALATQAGFEFIRPALVQSNTIGYAKADNLTDSTWQFHRAAVFTLKFSQGETAADYKTINTCGSGALESASAWCGSNDSFWARHETKVRHVQDLIGERVRQQRLMQKIVNDYNTNGAFRSPGGDSASLVSLVGYSGTAKNCSGMYAWGPIPIDCMDLYSVWGTPTVINFFSEQHVTVVAESSIKDSGGSFIGVATDMSLEP